MLVAVVQVGEVGVIVFDRLVHMRMRMRCRGDRSIVGMAVVEIVVPMGMHVGRDLVTMDMRVASAQHECDRSREDGSRDALLPRKPLGQECYGEQHAEERTGREQHLGTGSSNALGCRDEQDNAAPVTDRTESNGG